MFESPGDSDAPIDVLADWVEACALFLPDPIVSSVEVADMLATGVMEGPDPTDDIWMRLRRRSREIPSYPLTVEAEVARRNVARWQDVPAFSLLLLAELAGRYSLGSLVPSGSTFPRLFEHVVVAAQRGLFGGDAFRFGHPADGVTPTNLGDRLVALSSAFRCIPNTIRALEWTT